MTRFARWIALLIALGATSAAFAQTTGAIQGHCYLGGQQVLLSGMQSTNYQQGIVPACTVTVYLTGTQTKATIYADGSGTPLSNPFTANTATSLDPGGWIFWAATNQGLDVVLSGGGSNPNCTTAPNCYVAPITLTDVLSAAGGGASPSPGAYSIQATNSAGTGFTSDKYITVIPAIHTFNLGNLLSTAYFATTLGADIATCVATPPANRICDLSSDVANPEIVSTINVPSQMTILLPAVAITTSVAPAFSLAGSSYVTIRGRGPSGASSTSLVPSVHGPIFLLTSSAGGTNSHIEIGQLDMNYEPLTGNAPSSNTEDKGIVITGGSSYVPTWLYFHDLSEEFGYDGIFDGNCGPATTITCPDYTWTGTDSNIIQIERFAAIDLGNAVESFGSVNGGSAGSIHDQISVRDSGLNGGVDYSGTGGMYFYYTNHLVLDNTWLWKINCPSSFCSTTPTNSSPSGWTGLYLGNDHTVTINHLDLENDYAYGASNLVYIIAADVTAIGVTGFANVWGGAATGNYTQNYFFLSNSINSRLDLKSFQPNLISDDTCSAPGAGVVHDSIFENNGPEIINHPQTPGSYLSMPSGTNCVPGTFYDTGESSYTGMWTVPDVSPTSATAALPVIVPGVKLPSLPNVSAAAGIPSSTGGTVTASAYNYALIIALDANGSTAGATFSPAVATASCGSGPYTCSISWSWTAVTPINGDTVASYELFTCNTSACSPNTYFSVPVTDCTGGTCTYAQTLPASSGTSGTYPLINSTGSASVAALYAVSQGPAMQWIQSSSNPSDSGFIAIGPNSANAGWAEIYEARVSSTKGTFPINGQYVDASGIRHWQVCTTQTGVTPPYFATPAGCTDTRSFTPGTYTLPEVATGWPSGVSFTFASVAQFVGSLTTTAATSDSLAATGVPVNAACTAQAQNAIAAGLVGGEYIPLVATAGTVVVYHAATAGGIFSIFCQY